MAPTLLFLLVLILAFRARRSPERALRTQVMLWLLSGTGALIVTAAGGANIAPAVLFMPVLIYQAVHTEGLGALGTAAHAPRPGFWLVMLSIWGVISAAFLPRLFEGDVFIFTNDRTGLNPLGVVTMALQPVSGNVTQPAYLVGSTVMFLAISVMLQTDDRRAAFTTTVLRLAWVNAATALWSLGEINFGLPAVLDVVRKQSGYAVMDASSVGGLTRITGLFTEASSFAAFTLAMFAYCLRLWLAGVRTRQTGTLAALSLLLLLLSTSSTAYAALVAYVGAFALWASLSSLARLRAPRIGPVAGLLWLALCVLCVLIMLKPEWLDAVYTFFETTLLRKSESLSGVERGSWNQKAWENFIDTLGVGIGLGSARASSFPLVLLSNLGALGALLFSAFVIAVARMAHTRDANGQTDPNRLAALHAMLAGLIAATVSGTVFDLGLMVYGFAAAASATLLPLRRPGRHVAPASPASHPQATA